MSSGSVKVRVQPEGKALQQDGQTWKDSDEDSCSQPDRQSSLQRPVCHRVKSKRSHAHSKQEKTRKMGKKTLGPVVQRELHQWYKNCETPNPKMVCHLADRCPAFGAEVQDKTLWI